MKIIAFILLCLLPKPFVAFDCVFNSTNYLQNCLQFCVKFYSDPPQRAYYNQSSMNCEPVLRCISIFDFYDQSTNQCYSDPSFINQSASYIPTTAIVNLNSAPFYSSRMICVNGVAWTVSPQNTVCLCQFLWEDSGLVDLNGFYFKCDKVVQNLAGYFVPNLSFDASGKIVMYGTYSEAELSIMVSNLQTQATTLTYSYIDNITSSILYAVQMTPQESFIRQQDAFYLWIFLGAIYLVFMFSYCEGELRAVKVSQEELADRIKQIFSGQ